MKRLRRFSFLFLFALVVFGVMRSMTGSEVRVEPGSTLVVKIAGQYVEAPKAPLISRLTGGGTRPFLSLLSVLKLAQRDDRITTVVLRISDLNIGWGKAAELRDAIARLGKSGRKTIAYLELQSFSINLAYYVATAAEEIHVVPGAVMPLVGLSAEYLYFGEMWEKLGVEVQATKVGKYKSAVETLTDRGMSKASREMSNALIDAVDVRFVSAIAEGRGLLEPRVREIIDQGLVSASDLLERGLIDGIGHLSEIVAEDTPQLDSVTYSGVEPATVGFDPRFDVALIYGSGLVVTGESTRSSSGAPLFASDRFVKALDDASSNPEIDGIVLRMDSPGGSPLAAEVMWNAVTRARERGTPVVVSVSDVAASGAYYVASAADAIVISPGAVTGSIGVFALRPAFEELMGKLGVASESLQRGRHADFLDATRPMSDATRIRMQALATDIYQLFVERVAAGRALDVEQVDLLGQGRVWSADQALEVGLVDQLGGLREAVDWILAEIGEQQGSDVSLITYPAPETFSQQVTDLLQGRTLLSARAVSPIDAFLAGLPLPRSLATLREWTAMLPAGGPMLLPSALVEIR